MLLSALLDSRARLFAPAPMVLPVREAKVRLSMLLSALPDSRAPLHAPAPTVLPVHEAKVTAGGLPRGRASPSPCFSTAMDLSLLHRSAAPCRQALVSLLHWSIVVPLDRPVMPGSWAIWAGPTGCA